MDLRSYVQTFPRGERAAEICRIANAIGVSAPAIRHWISGIRPMSEAMAPAVEVATQGRVRCELMRPDVEWHRDTSGQITGYYKPVARPARAEKLSVEQGAG